MRPVQGSRPKGFTKHLRTVLLAGALVAVPLAVTYLVFKWAFLTLDGIFQPAIQALLGRSLPGVGLVALVIAVYLLGLVTTNVVGHMMLRGLDAMLARTPVVQYVYSAARQVVEAVRSSRRVPFNRVVIVEFPRRGMQSLGFVTGQAIDINGEQKFPIFVPTAPTPMTGYLVLMSAEDITDTNLTVDEALRMVLSGGLVSPEKITRPVP